MLGCGPMVKATLKQMVFEIGTLRLELIAAQESEAVWKTEADKADQRRLQAETEVKSLTEKLTSLQTAYLASAERDNSLTKELFDSRAEIESLSKLTEDCLNVIRVYCPIYYNDAMDRFKTINKCTH